MVFLQNSLRSLAGNLRAEFDPEQGIRIPEQGFGALPEIPTRRNFVGRRARLVGAGAALAGGPRLALRQPLHERPPELPIPKPAKSPPRPCYKSPAISAGTDACFELNDSANWTWFCSAPLAGSAVDTP